MLIKNLLAAKAKALCVHLAISALIFLPFLYLIWFEWFPPPMFFTDGGWQGLRIMLVVDMVIGPALTFLVFNPAKSRGEKIFDFSCIGLVQVAALTYGAINVESKRVYTMAFSEGGFVANTKDDYQTQEIAPGAWDRLGDGPIYWVYTREPASGEEAAGSLAYLFVEGLGPERLQFLHEPLGEHVAELRQWGALDPGKLDPQKHAAAIAVFARLREKHPDPEVFFVQHRGYFGPAILAIDAQGQVVGHALEEAHYKSWPKPKPVEAAPEAAAPEAPKAEGEKAPAN